MKRKIVLATLTAISVSYAKDLTLQEAIETGLKNNYEVKATENLLKSKEYQYESAKGMRLPSLTFRDVYENKRAGLCNVEHYEPKEA